MVQPHIWQAMASYHVIAAVMWLLPEHRTVLWLLQHSYYVIPAATWSFCYCFVAVTLLQCYYCCCIAEKRKETRSSMLLSDANKTKETRVKQASKVYYSRSTKAC